jgi:hypothetical protein
MEKTIEVFMLVRIEGKFVKGDSDAGIGEGYECEKVYVIGDDEKEIDISGIIDVTAFNDKLY